MGKNRKQTKKNLGFTTQVEIVGNPWETINCLKKLKIDGVKFTHIGHLEDVNGMEQCLDVEFSIDNNVWKVDLDFDKVFDVSDYVVDQIYENCPNCRY